MATTVAAARAHAAEHSQSGLWSWITTVDHKRIAILYFVTFSLYEEVRRIRVLDLSGQFEDDEEAG